MVPLVGSMATTRFWPLTATYSAWPSGEYVDCAVRATWPPTAGMETVVPVPRVPSGWTGNRVSPPDWGSHRNFPSGEYVGPSCPTVTSEIFWLTPVALPTDQISL